MGLWVQPEVPVGWEATVRPVPPSSLALTRSCLGLGTLLVARSPLFPQSRCLGTRADPGNTGGQKQGVLETRSWKLTAGVSPEGLGASYSCDSFLELLCPFRTKSLFSISLEARIPKSRCRQDGSSWRLRGRSFSPLPGPGALSVRSWPLQARPLRPPVCVSLPLL